MFTEQWAHHHRAHYWGLNRKRLIDTNGTALSGNSLWVFTFSCADIFLALKSNVGLFFSSYNQPAIGIPPNTDSSCNRPFDNVLLNNKHVDHEFIVVNGNSVSYYLRYIWLRYHPGTQGMLDSNQIPMHFPPTYSPELLLDIPKNCKVQRLHCTRTIGKPHANVRLHHIPTHRVYSLTLLAHFVDLVGCCCCCRCSCHGSAEHNGIDRSTIPAVHSLFDQSPDVHPNIYK
jgi:hypothetical protein